MERALQDEVWQKPPSDIEPAPELLRVSLSASPPTIARPTVGTWVIDSENQLSVLCELEFDRTRLRMLTGYGHDPEKLAVYSRWLQAGHEPPPVWAEIANDHMVIVVTDGEHRAAALQRAGRRTLLAWLSEPNAVQPPRLLSHESVVARAVQMGLPRAVDGAPSLWISGLMRHIAER